MWFRVINALAGIWLMAAPSVLGYDGAAAVSHWIVGPITASFAVIAMPAATRSARLVNLPLGLWLLISPVVLGFGSFAAVNSLLAGVTIASLALFSGQVTQQFGGGWSALWRPDRLAKEEV